MQGEVEELAKERGRCQVRVGSRAIWLEGGILLLREREREREREIRREREILRERERERFGEREREREIRRESSVLHLLLLVCLVNLPVLLNPCEHETLEVLTALFFGFEEAESVVRVESGGRVSELDELLV